MLVRRRETKEDDLIEVLKLEKKHLRSLMEQMRKEKFVNVRLIMETDEVNKSTRRNYYSINYRMFVNVVKYKIDHVRRRIEADERDHSSRASFICQTCRKTYTDLELGQILDTSSGSALFVCSHCGGSVDEDPNVRPQIDSRLIQAKFNEQMSQIYETLKDLEMMDLSINEIDRNNMTAGNNGPCSSDGPMTNGFTSVPGSTLPPGFTNGSAVGHQHQQNNSGAPESNAFVQDQYPIQITDLDKKYKTDGNIDGSKPSGNSVNPEIEALLLREESLANAMNTSQDNSLSEEPYYSPLTNISILMIPVGKTIVPVHKISDEHIEFMTLQQRDDYKRTMQQVYNLIYG